MCSANFKFMRSSSMTRIVSLAVVSLAKTALMRSSISGPYTGFDIKSKTPSRLDCSLYLLNSFAVKKITFVSAMDLSALMFSSVSIPFICGISFEILRFVGRHDDKGICRGLSKPGLWLQKYTTAEPDGPIIEVAIAAMQAVIPENADEDAW